MGQLKKLKIFVFSDPMFKSLVQQQPIELQINPEKYTHNHQVAYDMAQGIGTSGTSIRFLKITPEKVNFDIYLDGTGAYDPGKGDTNFSVAKFIKDFKSLVYDFNGKIHSSNYLKLVWGKQMGFRCRLTSMNISYTMFKPNGDPLRATLSLAFEEFLDNRYIILEEKRSSPDLSHVKTVKAGDTLPNMCYEIYQDSTLFMAVAEANQLDNYRNLTAGTQLRFPPLKEDTI